MTKLISLALAALVATSTLASAASPTIGSNSPVAFHGSDSSHGSYTEWLRVDSPAAGVIEVYEFRQGQIGRLLATQPVDAGTNWRVRVGVGSDLPYDAVALLKVNGQVVGEANLNHRF